MIQWELKTFKQLSAEVFYAVGALRQEVFVVEQNCPYQDFDGLDQASYHLLGWDKNHQLVAYTRIVPKGISYPHAASIGRVVTAPNARGKGLGRILMQKSIAECLSLFPYTPIRIGAQSYLLDFYRSLGFETTNKHYLEDGIPHSEMDYVK